ALALAQAGIGEPAFVLLAGVLTIAGRSLLAADQAILLLSLALIPVATAVGVHPWLAVVAILALGLRWHLPAQSPEHLVPRRAALVELGTSERAVHDEEVSPKAVAEAVTRRAARVEETRVHRGVLVDRHGVGGARRVRGAVALGRHKHRSQDVALRLLAEGA